MHVIICMLVTVEVKIIQGAIVNVLKYRKGFKKTDEIVLLKAELGKIAAKRRLIGEQPEYVVKLMDHIVDLRRKRDIPFMQVSDFKIMAMQGFNIPKDVIEDLLGLLVDMGFVLYFKVGIML